MNYSAIRKYSESFISLIYPKHCIVCESTLFGNESLICTACRHSLPETNFHEFPGNQVEQLFWGRLPVKHATALLYFDQGSKYRQLIHQLKYQGRKDAGLFLGKLLGHALTKWIDDPPDCIIPIPLHPSKLRRRGFNQSQILSEGIADVLNIDICNEVLKRVKYTQTQTRRKRYDRWKNVEGIFKCSHTEKIRNRHVLLVDDVITTGATMEAAGTVFNDIEGIRLSIAASAFAHL